MPLKRVIAFSLIFFLCVVGTFAGIGFVAKIILGGKNEVGRVSTQAITCALALFGYLYCRGRLGGIKPGNIVVWPVLGWAVLGLLFAVIPYFALQNVAPLRLANFQAPLIIVVVKLFRTPQ